ncbi:MAG: hypothetical protein GX591_15830, partial [Planctomycetes bacterium]|nr:hypothetical protein [Planctomycetota bacterium]
LVVSVGSAVRAKAAENQTRAVLKAVQGAIEAYADTYRTVPNHVVTWRNYDPLPPLPNQCAMANTGTLVHWLRRVNSAGERLAELSAELFVEDASIDPDPTDGDTTKVTATYMLDPWGTPLNYQANGGAGGTPVVISAGVNVKWGDGDDLRSDDQ